MAKYVFGAPVVKHVIAGAGFDEDWFDLRTSLTQGHIVASSMTTNDMERGARLAFALIDKWSLVDASGQPVPVTWDNFMQLPMGMVQPIYDVLGSADFLEQK